MGLMSGDCLFNMGCGRVFTGNYAQMQTSLGKLKELPDNTVVFCAHEYTTPNCGFALEVEPGNAALQERAAVVKARREAGLATVPTLLGHEKATNPFIGGTLRRSRAPAVWRPLWTCSPSCA